MIELQKLFDTAVTTGLHANATGDKKTAQEALDTASAIATLTHRHDGVKKVLELNARGDHDAALKALQEITHSTAP